MVALCKIFINLFEIIIKISSDKRAKTRKIEEERRSFQQEWTVKYFFTDVRNKTEIEPFLFYPYKQ